MASFNDACMNLYDGGALTVKDDLADIRNSGGGHGYLVVCSFCIHYNVHIASWW